MTPAEFREAGCHMATRSPQSKAAPLKPKTKVAAKPVTPKKPVRGRPTVFKKDYIEVAANLTSAGFTLPMLAENLGVATSTISKWMLDHRAFSDAITRARRPADAQVIESLHKRANGYDYTEQVLVKMKNADGSERVELVEVRKHLPADVTAGRYRANNRFRDHWRNPAGRQRDELPEITAIMF